MGLITMKRPYRRAGSRPPARRLGVVSPRVWLLLGAFAMLGAAAIVLADAMPNGTGSLGVGLLMIPFAAVGLVVAHRQPQNSIGWLLSALALLTTLGLDASAYAILAYRYHRHGLPLGRLAVALAPAWVPVLVLLPLPIALFPAGRIPRGRWRWTFWGYLALAAAFVVGPLGITDLRAFTDRRVLVDSTGSLAALNAPEHGAGAVVNDLVVAAYAVLFALMTAYQLVQFRRSRDAERQQLKWFLAGGAVAVIGVLVASAWDPASFLFFCVVALPVGIGVGILKYRLFDIDRLISRTLSYTIITGLLVSLFAGVVVLMTRVLPFSSPVGVAASTLVAAALFNPLRRRVQRVVDRRFNRARYDAQAAVAGFSGRLRDAIDLDAISGELLEVVEQTIAPAHASIWIKQQLG